MRGYVSPLLAACFLLCHAPWAAAQSATPISMGEAVEFQLTPETPSAEFTFTGRTGVFAEVMLLIDERDFELTLTLLAPNGDEVGRNQGLNYPQFQGAYLFVPTQQGGVYRARVDARGLQEPADFRLEVNERVQESELEIINVYESRRGWIGPTGDIDFYAVHLPRNTPMLVVAHTPHNILDTIVAAFDTQDNMMGVNGDFWGTRSALLVFPPETGIYLIAVGGQFQDSVGPYELMVTPVALENTPFEDRSFIAVPGDILSYQAPLKQNQVYDFRVTAEPGLNPILALVTPFMQIITAGAVGDVAEERVIPGFTPLEDENLYLLIFAEDSDQIGEVHVSTSIRPDEPDRRTLSLGDTLTGVIGPVGDVDSYVISVEQGQRYSLLAAPTWHLFDPAMRVSNREGEEIFYNDNRVDGVSAFLSGIVFPEAGEYVVEVFASPDQEFLQRLTGVYDISFAQGAPFDFYPPFIFTPFIETEPLHNGLLIRLTDEIEDDTWPLTVRLRGDRSGQVTERVMEFGEEIELLAAGYSDEVFFISVEDSADDPNRSIELALPAPIVIADVTGQPLGIAIDVDNAIYLTDSRKGEVMRLSPAGATETVSIGEEGGGGTLGPNALAFDAQGMLYVSDARLGRVDRIDPTDGSREIHVEGLHFPTALAFGMDGELYIAQRGSNDVLRIQPNGTRDVFAEGIRNPTALAFGPDGLLYAVNDDRGQSSIFRIQPNGDAQLLLEPFADTLEGLAIDTDGYLYTADGSAGILFRVSPDGEVVYFTWGLSGPIGLAHGRGEARSLLYATNLGATGNFYFQQVIAIPTGRLGMTLPYSGETGVLDWMVW